MANKSVIVLGIFLIFPVLPIFNSCASVGKSNGVISKEVNLVLEKISLGNKTEKVRESFLFQLIKRKGKEGRDYWYWRVPSPDSIRWVVYLNQHVGGLFFLTNEKKEFKFINYGRVDLDCQGNFETVALSKKTPFGS